VELRDFVVEHGEADEDEEQMSAEDLHGGGAEGEEGLTGDEALDGLACPVDGSGAGDEIDHAERADAPLVE
jgi:hypothetical protein